MDIYDYIKADHKKVADLFDQFEKAFNETQMLEIVTIICLELFVHAESEQSTFYQAIESHPEYVKDINHAKHEHDEILKLIKDVSEPVKIDAAWKEKVFKLKSIVEHHVKEEEGKIFSDAKKIFSDSDAWILKEKMHYAKVLLFHKLAENKSIVETL